MFHGLKNLQVLNLSDNKISTIDDAFIELSSLISLNLSNNELTKINSKTIRIKIYIKYYQIKQKV